MNITSFGKPLASDIETFEKHIGFSLPADYKEFLIENNGGSVRNCSFVVSDLLKVIDLHVLYGITPEKNNNLYTWHDEYSSDLFENSVIIGSDLGGGLIVICNSEDTPGVYYWDHTYNFEQSDDDNNVYRISNDFTAFVNALQCD